MTTLPNNAMYFNPDALDSFDPDFTPGDDFLDADQSFDFEDADLGGEMIGGLPATYDIPQPGGEHHEKRKSPEENVGAEEGDSKRQEVQEGEKSAKKPGRKPLTNEPTTKRKAQNRAAQRAFRERKEKHLKDLETKVAELEKAKEADRHENGLLKAQLERMSMELREYRKRLSTVSNANRSPTTVAAGGQPRSNSGSFGTTFDFDFPKFGSLPGNQLFDMPQTTSPLTATPVNKFESVTPPTHRSPSFGNGSSHMASHKNSVGSTYGSSYIGNSPSNTSSTNLGNFDAATAFLSTADNMHGFASTLPAMEDTGSLDGLFSPSILKSASIQNNGGYFRDSHDRGVGQQAPTHDTNTGGETTAGLDRVFQFNGGSNASDSTSPSASSNSQWNVNGLGNSSCETSPEPSHDSPQPKDNRHSSRTTTNPTTAPSSRQNSTQPQLPDPKSVINKQIIGGPLAFGNIDFSVPATADFDPLLFGDYRDSQDAIVGDGDFTGGFFDDALQSAPSDFHSPSNLFGILQSPQPSLSTLSPSSGATNAPTPSRNLLAEIDKTRDGGDDDYGLPSSKLKKPEGKNLISCNKIWNQLQSNPDFQEGKFDLDGLCAELRTKARCSESGMMVDQKHVDQALRKLGKKDATGALNEGSSKLMFENDSWERVMQKFGQNSHSS